jgi:ubiquinol-cytochrome c reductase cytochrome b subunit
MRWAPSLSLLNAHLVDYPTPVNLNYNWSFGSTAGLCLAIQLLTGIFLAMHYTPEVHHAFASVEHIIRDVQYGWVLRYLHANTASFFFILVYAHIFRGLFHGSFTQPRELLWCSGVVIFILIIATAFIGYVLPWGQMSFWGATVITNLFSAIPKVGPGIVTWLWGGFSVDNATLNRFFSLHYLIPFAITAIVLVHLGLLHQHGSNNPLGGPSTPLNFYPYFYVKDLLSFLIIAWCLIGVVVYAPNVLGHPDNYIPANPMSTPAHIVPEWYFLPFYAILRSIPDKLGGVVAIGGALIILLLLPFISSPTHRSCHVRPVQQFLFWVWLANFILLGWLGQMPVENPFVVVGQVCTLLYFVLLLYRGSQFN